MRFTFGLRDGGETVLENRVMSELPGLLNVDAVTENVTFVDLSDSVATGPTRRSLGCREEIR